MSRSVRNNADLLRALAKLKSKQRIALLKTVDNKFVHCLCECVHNTLNGRVPLTGEQKKALSRHKRVLRRLLKRGESIKKKKQILLQKGGAFLPFLLSPLLSAVLSFVK